MTKFEILQSKLTIADTAEFREIYLPQILDAMEEYKLQQQKEISDEEIEKASEDYEFKESIDFTEGAKWYREQLKQRK